jgi:hypothetical protein
MVDHTRDFKALYRATGITPKEVFALENEWERRKRDALCQESQLKVFSCICRSAWCEHCSKFCSTSETIRERLSDMRWDCVRQVVLTVSRETPAHEAMAEIRQTRAIPHLIRALGLGTRRWLWVLEFHADGYPHWHLFIENTRGRSGMIGKHKIQRLWGRGNVWESYPKTKDHWGAICGYHRKSGYFAGESKAHQLTLPDYLMGQSRVRKYGSNFKLGEAVSVFKEKASGVGKDGKDGTRVPTPQARAKRVQKPYNERLKACNTTCKVCKGGVSWDTLPLPGSVVREKASQALDEIDYKTFNGTHEEIVDFIRDAVEHINQK